MVGVVLVLLGLPSGPAAATGGADGAGAPGRISYDVGLRADATGTRWSGRERITFTNTGREPLREVYLRLWGNAVDGCAAPPVTVSGLRGGTDAGLSVGCTALRVRLARPLAPGDGTSVAFRLTLTVPDRDHRFGRQGPYRLLGNALPVLAVRDAAGWHLDPDVGFGESYYTLAADFRVRLDHPAGLVVPATGRTVTGAAAPGRAVTVSRADKVRDFAWAAGPFRTASEVSPDGVLVRAFWTADTAPANVAQVRADAAASVDDFGRRFGRYPYGELDLVMSPAFGFGSMEYPGLVLLWTTDDGAATVHEVAHQWWYGIVGNDEFGAPWLDESFASYASLLFAGDDGAGCWADLWWPDRQGLEITRSMGWLAEPADHSGWTFPLYTAGPCALQDLERELGSPAMAALMRDYARDHWYGISTTAGFKAAAERAAGHDLTRFWADHRIR
ncbi:hypothetical protein SRB5_08620 [Streptomyces sp. RB5]|uniref:Peptidase M1 membrane alanine aminopeptidase domain-containing protein n=1 Tax=Streptomyces smaragdinus TaxID=2585196 RepID=A0A7K0CBD3_9ACTN|nr:hypothetical protein [Streptomyces smaragdinus]